MFKPKFHLTLTTEHFYPSTVICSGSQLISIINFLETKLPPHTWYSIDIDAIGSKGQPYNPESNIIKKIGTSSSLKKICTEVDQFLSGVFFAIDNAKNYESISIEVNTEEKPFRILNIEGVFLEIRAFDTSFFDFFSEDAQILKELCTHFKSHVNQDNKSTWNDLVLIKKEAPLKYHPNKIGMVCGMSKIVFEPIAKKYHCPLGTWLYTIKFQDGTNFQILENYLEKSNTLPFEAKFDEIPKGK